MVRRPHTRLRRRPAERVRAWLYTGPLGHLYGALADIGVLWLLWVTSLARERLRARLGGRRAG